MFNVGTPNDQPDEAPEGDALSTRDELSRRFDKVFGADRVVTVDVERIMRRVKTMAPEVRTPEEDLAIGYCSSL